MPDPESATPLAPVDEDGLAAVAVGTAIWVVLAVVCLVLRQRLDESGSGWWLGVTLAGAGLGIAGVAFLRHRRRRTSAGADLT